MAIETDADVLQIMRQRPHDASPDVLDARPRLLNIGMLFGDLMAQRSSRLILRRGVNPISARHDLRFFSDSYFDGQEPLVLRGASHSVEEVETFSKVCGRNGLIVAENHYNDVLSSELTGYLGKLAHEPASAMICSIEIEGVKSEDRAPISHIANLATKYTVEPPNRVVLTDTDSGAWAQTGRA